MTKPVKSMWVGTSRRAGRSSRDASRIEAGRCRRSFFKITLIVRPESTMSSTRRTCLAGSGPSKTSASLTPPERADRGLHRGQPPVARAPESAQTAVEVDRPAAAVDLWLRRRVGGVPVHDPLRAGALEPAL